MRLRNMPSISSYADSAKFYASAKQWRSPPLPDARKLDDNGQTYKSIRTINHAEGVNGIAYAWRYHDTDVVIWVNENFIILNTWGSMSTTTFMQSLLPRDFDVNMHHPAGKLLGLYQSTAPLFPEGSWDDPDRDAKIEAWRAEWDRVRGTTRWHLCDDMVVLKRADAVSPWAIMDGSIAWNLPVVNTKRAHAARAEFHTSDFRHWFQAQRALNHQARTHDQMQDRALRRLRGSYTGDADALVDRLHANSTWGLTALAEALRTPSEWWGVVATPHIVSPMRFSRGGRIVSRTREQENSDWVDQVNQSVLLAAYWAHKAVEIHPMPYLVGMQSVNAQHRLEKRWEVNRFSWPVVNKGEV